MFKDREGHEWKLLPNLGAIEDFERATGVRCLSALTVGTIDPKLTFDGIFGMTGNLYQYLLFISFTEEERKEQKLTAEKVRDMVPMRDMVKLTTEAFNELIVNFTDQEIEDDEIVKQKEEGEEDPNS